MTLCTSKAASEAFVCSPRLLLAVITPSSHSAFGLVLFSAVHGLTTTSHLLLDDLPQCLGQDELKSPGS